MLAAQNLLSDIMARYWWLITKVVDYNVECSKLYMCLVACSRKARYSFKLQGLIVPQMGNGSHTAYKTMYIVYSHAEDTMRSGIHRFSISTGIVTAPYNDLVLYKSHWSKYLEHYIMEIPICNFLF